MPSNIHTDPACMHHTTFTPVLHMIGIPFYRAANLMICNLVRRTKKMYEMHGGLQAWDMLTEMKYCGSSTVTTINKHSQNLMLTIFSSGCYVPYIYYNSYTTSLFQASPVFDLLFYLSARSLHYRPLQNLGLQLHVMLITSSSYRLVQWHM